MYEETLRKVFFFLWGNPKGSEIAQFKKSDEIPVILSLFLISEASTASQLPCFWTEGF